MDLKNVCVYCGSSPTLDPVVEKEIRAFGRRFTFVRQGLSLLLALLIGALLGVLL